MFTTIFNRQSLFFATASRGLILACIALAALAGRVNANTIYSNGFETNVFDWDAFGGTFNATRVPSGTNGITSASGSFHAENSASGSASRWGGYNYGAGAVPTSFLEYSTSVDVFLDVGGPWANNTRFDFSSAINDSLGSHFSDFIFNAGFYDDTDGSPGSGTDRFVISASTNSQPGSAFAKNPAKDPIAVSTTGWYTFEHHFFDNAGALGVEMSIYDASNVLINSWTPTVAANVISGIGGNRYGWFDFNEFSTLAFDNASLTVVPEPSALMLIAIGGFGAFWFARRHAVKRHLQAVDTAS